MKSLMMRSIYAGLGLLGSGTETVQELGRKLAKQAAISEKEGEKIARQLQTRSEKAVKAIQETWEDEAEKVVRAVRLATRQFGKPGAKKAAHRRSRKKPASSSHK